MGLVEKSFQRLRQIDSVHFLLRLHCFFVRLHERFAANHEELVRSLMAQRCDSSDSVSHQRAEDGVRPERIPEPRPSDSMDMQSDNIDMHSDSSSDRIDVAWDWKGYPGPLPGTTAYGRLSTTWMIYSVVRTLFLDQLAALVDTLSRPWLGIGGNCFLMGRVVSHSGFKDSYNVIFPLFHLIWRGIDVAFKRHFKLTMVNFMLHSDVDVERFLELLEGGKFRGEFLSNRRQATSRSSGLRPLFTRAGSRFVVDQKGRRLLGPTSYDWEELMEDRTSLNERVLRHAMCYPVYYGNQIHFRLRPNRTLSARARLKDRIALSFVITTSILLPLIAFMATVITLVVLTDKRYLATYPGCYPELEQLEARGQLGFFSIHFFRHHAISGLVDGLENVIVWLDCGTALFYVPVLCYLLNYDILLYWSGVHQKLEMLMAKVRWRNCQPGGGAKSKKLPDALSYFDEQLDTEIHELHYELADFFHEVERADQLISDVLTLALGIWFTGCLVVGFNFLALNRTTMPAFMVLILAVSFAVMSTATHFLLALSRSCKRSYLKLCSMMAEDKVERKCQAMKLMDFFTEMNRTFYTLAHRFPYKSSTFLTIVSYSVSCFLMAVTLFGGKPIRSIVDTNSTSTSKLDKVLNHLGIY